MGFSILNMISPPAQRTITEQLENKPNNTNQGNVNNSNNKSMQIKTALAKANCNRDATQLWATTL